MVHSHLDIQSILEEELKKQRESRILHLQDLSQKKHVRDNPDFNVLANGETVPNEDNLGPQQVESLLAFVVGNPTERFLEDTERDNIVYDALGDHRILGKHKKKKKKKARPTVSY